MSWGASIALLVDHNCEHTNNIKNVWIWTIIIMQDIKRGCWERKIQTQIHGYILRFEPLLYVSAFTQKDFHYIHKGPFTKGPQPRNYNLQTGSTQLQLSHTSTQERGTKPSTKQRENTTLWSQRSQITLGDLKRPQTKPLIIQDPRG